MRTIQRFLFFIILLSLISGQSSCLRDKPLLITGENGTKGFIIEEYPDYKLIIVNNPWDDTSVLAKYYLVKDDSVTVPNDGIMVKIPITSIAATSCTHYEFLTLLDEVESISAVCNSGQIYNSHIRERFSAGKITDLGDNFNMNLEKLFLVRPQAVMVSGYEQNDKYSKLIEKSGIPVIYNQEWHETTLLGRAEWIKFVAAFYDKSSIADSIFEQIENRYNAIAAKAAGEKHRPEILSGGDFRGTWYLPGGQSYMANMYRDAGAGYLYSENKNSASLSFTFESILNNFIMADYWFGAPFYSLEELRNADVRYTYFAACKNGQVYHFNKRRTPSGGNDFWESAVARPDLLLADVIKILHPELLPEHELFYIGKLE